VMCGARCCNPGEWCDDSGDEPACRCGDKEGCKGDGVGVSVVCCPSEGEPGEGVCGDTCRDAACE
jgi:hypothetical protein